MMGGSTWLCGAFARLRPIQASVRFHRSAGYLAGDKISQALECNAKECNGERRERRERRERLRQARASIAARREMRR